MPNDTQQKEERSEYVSIYVTKSVKTEFESAKDNQALKETIIKNYLQSERNWLEDELKQIDEATIKYSAKLIGIKEAFGKTQDAYVEEVEAIYKKANETFKKLDSVSVNVSRNIESVKTQLSGVLTQINTIDFYKIEKLTSLVDKVNGMSDKELELLKKLLH